VLFVVDSPLVLAIQFGSSLIEFVQENER